MWCWRTCSSDIDKTDSKSYFKSVAFYFDYVLYVKRLGTRSNNCRAAGR